MGCEALGMPCGMQFPSGGGGIDPSGCTYGGGNCGGMIYGFGDDQPDVVCQGDSCIFKVVVTEYEIPTTVGPPEKPAKPRVTISRRNPPKPKTWHGFLTGFLPCYFAQVTTNMFGDDANVTGTFTTAMAFVKWRNLTSLASLAAWEGQAVGTAGMACNNN
jgi:hypothetical protein